MGKDKDGNYKERMQIWKEELLNDKAHHENILRSDGVSIKLMQQSNMLHKKQIEHLDEEIRFADQELAE